MSVLDPGMLNLCSSDGLKPNTAAIIQMLLHPSVWQVDPVFKVFGSELCEDLCQMFAFLVKGMHSALMCVMNSFSSMTALSKFLPNHLSVAPAISLSMSVLPFSKSCASNFKASPVTLTSSSTRNLL